MAHQANRSQALTLSRFLNFNTLLIFLPVAVIGQLLHWSDGLIFVASGLAIVPLSKLIGDATEELAVKIGPQLGGLVNATLGNAAELIITIFALNAGLLDLVKASIVGSVLGNLLLVTGMSFVVGGLKNGVQTFSRRTASSNATLVILAFLVLAIPSAFDSALTGTKGHELLFSDGIALVMIVLYGLSMLYTLREPQARLRPAEEEKVLEEIEQHPVNVRGALIMLALATVGIVLASEALVNTVEPVAHGLGLSEFFIGIIIVPLIGNVAEHVVAVELALKNRMDIALSISLGSSLQVALFVAPILVLISLLFPARLLLVFSPYELVALAVASIATALVTEDGESNWLEGVELLALYVILGLAFYLLPSVGVG